MIDDFKEIWADHFAEENSPTFLFNYISSYQFSFSPWDLFREFAVSEGIKEAFKKGLYECFLDSAFTEKMIAFPMKNLIEIIGNCWLDKVQKAYSYYWFSGGNDV